MFFLDEKGFITKKKQPRNFSELATIERTETAFDLFTDKELIEEAEKGYNFATPFFYDVECYRNYFLCAFESLLSGKIVYFEHSPDVKLWRDKFEWVLTHFNIIGFNSINYDLPICSYALKLPSNLQLKEFSDKIIKEKMRVSDLQKEYNFRVIRANHIDLKEVAPLSGNGSVEEGVKQHVSLKLYGGRLHAPRLQDLPYKEYIQLTKQQAENVKYYCINGDLKLTRLLYNELLPQIKLRTQMGYEYKQDLRSKSDAQIAETVISNEVQKINGYYAKRPQVSPGTIFNYEVPQFVQYQTPKLQQMLETVRNAQYVISGNGGFYMPEEIANLNLNIGSSVYRMGLGGLHSSEKSVAHISDSNFILKDIDVESFYPRTILNLQLYPHQMGKTFLKVYNNIVERRLIAKHNKDKVTADSLKITINGSFGKLGSMYSSLYAPQLMIQVTITGQLVLLMFIELIELNGFSVVSANTDGIVVKCPRSRENDLQALVSMWEQVTGYKTEETRYSAIFSRDVNNYIAVKEKGGDPSARFLDEQLGIKTKGVFCERGSALNSVLSKNPEMLICNDALITFLKLGTPIEETILKCQDIRRFTSIKTVAGGGYKDELYLGKVVRWYYAKDTRGEINYLTNGNKVGKSAGAKPLMDLPPQLPDDIDYDRYIFETNEMLYDIGYYTPASLF